MAAIDTENYGRALHATRAALVINARSIKALYRAAKAFLALDRVKDVLGCCDMAQDLDLSNPEFERLRTQAQGRAEQLERREKEREERCRRTALENEALQIALVARGLWVATSDDPPDNPTPTHFDAEARPSYSSLDIPLIGATEPWKAPDPIRTPLVFPVMLLYPQHNTSDLISEYHEDTPIGMHLDIMFPPEARGSLPWDPQGEYVSSQLSVIARTRKGRLLRVGHKLSLRTLLDQGAQPGADGKMEDRDGIVLRDGIIDLYVFPKNSSAERTWIAETKGRAT